MTFISLRTNVCDALFRLKVSINTWITITTQGYIGQSYVILVIVGISGINPHMETTNQPESDTSQNEKTDMDIDFKKPLRKSLIANPS